MNPLLAKLAAGAFRTHLTSQQRLDALKVYTDEGYHALFCVDLKEQVMAVTGVRPVGDEVPAFQARFRAILDGTCDAELRPVLELLAVSTHEQLITASLRRANDPTLVSGVRESILDHARDEAVHSAYFAQVFERVWRGLTLEARHGLAPILPRVICCFLDPDVDSLALDLRDCGFSDASARQLIAESYPEAEQRASRRSASTQALSLFESCGLYAHPTSRESFGALGFLG